MAGKVLNFKLGGETDLLSGSSFYVGGAMFQLDRYLGMCYLLVKMALNTVLLPYSHYHLFSICFEWACQDF